jgi:hypothetical protein
MSSIIPVCGSMAKVRGISRAMPIVEVRPGIAPMDIPAATPIKIVTSKIGLKAMDKVSNTNSPLRQEFSQQL